MDWAERLPRITPLRGAVAYGVFGVCWILFSDRALLALTADGNVLTTLQSLKGGVFVVGSTGLIYLIADAQSRQRDALTELLRFELQHVSILHRILRHNLRNKSAIIAGYVTSVKSHVPKNEASAITAIMDAVDELVALSEKAARLNGEISEGAVETTRDDVGTVVREVCDTAATTYPDAVIDARIPDEDTTAVVPAAFEWVLEELVENAVEHNTNTQPKVECVVTPADDSVTVEITDNGPGIPSAERNAHDVDPEQPLVHSQGIGLWVVRLLTTLAGGTCVVGESNGDEGGAVIRLTYRRTPADRTSVADLSSPNPAIATQ